MKLINPQIKLRKKHGPWVANVTAALRDLDKTRSCVAELSIIAELTSAAYQLGEFCMGKTELSEIEVEELVYTIQANGLYIFAKEEEKKAMKPELNMTLGKDDDI